jgi:hypothetical protein
MPPVPSIDYVIVTAGYVSESLIAAVGIVPSRAPLCDNFRAMEAAIRSLRDSLTATGDPTRPGRAPVLLESPAGGRPPDELPAPNPLPNP